jgi:hypothetical protein
MFYRTLKMFIITMLYITITSNAMMVTTPNSTTSILNVNEKVKGIEFKNNETLSIQTDSTTYAYNTKNKSTEVSSSFDGGIKTKQPTEDNTYQLTIFANTLYIYNKKNNKTAFITHGSKIENAFFTPDQKYIVILSPQKIAICGFNGTTTFSVTPQNGQRIPDEWFTKVAVNQNSSKIAISTSKNNVHVVDIPNITYNDSLTSKKAKNNFITNGISNNPVLKPWYQRWWEKIKRNKWKTLAISSTSVAAGFTLYKWWKK